MFYYFGCWDKVGHYLFDQDGRQIWDSKSAALKLPWTVNLLDTGLVRHIPQMDGNAVLDHKDGWTALSFWDRSVDSRPGSCSVYITDMVLEFQPMLNAMKVAFPKLMDRYRFPIQEVL